ncbi:sugar diacid recognition domain-containing protein [Bacillus sp. ISL-77]|uniref:CdaR family transcriptional regulator n=1 Tax=Bacillus sp. ISL-77 TaxID=2819138 RepID=UPI001BE8A376|nr:sugar diacid recognition domain-containing protein [Bacillus sp. ISL-77]MBT2740830.1 helix-turn-helix domain-containing protein [Bacillus sp. ISL-77]
MKKHFQISPVLAQTIVDAARELIGKEISFIQLDGEIIASTDPNRIGSFHEAAFLVKDKRMVIEVSENDTFKGTKKGINYPVMIDHEMFGIIGISGDPEECRSRGFILTKITELLIKEQMTVRKVHSLDELRSSVVRMLIFENQKKDEIINEHLHQLQYELEENAFVAIIHLHGLNNPSSLPVNMHDILLKQGIKLFTYLFPNQYAIIGNESQYKAVFQSLETYFLSMDIRCSIGIGSVGVLEELVKSYKHAKLALKHAISKQSLICEYTKLELEMIMENIDPHTRNDYVTKLVGELTEEEITLLHIYYKNNLSLKKTASDLIIHKNTLQYRLEKIAEKTKVNPRDFHDSVKLYVALLLQTL